MFDLNFKRTTYVTVAVVVAVTILVFVETAKTRPAHVTALGYAAGENTIFPLTILQVFLVD